MAQLKSGKAAREERERMILLKHKFDNRITITKFGKAALDAGDYTTALQRFVEYMQTMAEAKNVKDFYTLRPSHFDPKKDLTEMLLMSHVYFEMARIYDAVPRFAEDAKKCLEQFVTFTANQPFQVVNSEMIRKYLKKSQFKNHEAFRNAYNQIYVQSKKCFVVTFCYGNDHAVTQQYRELKDVLLTTRLGQECVRLYYLHSSTLVPRWESHKSVHFISKYTIKPLLLLFSKTLLRLIIK